MVRSVLDTVAGRGIHPTIASAPGEATPAALPATEGDAPAPNVVSAAVADAVDDAAPNAAVVTASNTAVFDTTAFVTTIGDTANFSDCMDHLRAQNERMAIDVIDRVAPMSAAFQQMHARCRTEFYIQVDEDMILFPHAVQSLRAAIAAAPPNIAMVCAPLWDCDADCAIWGVKIYRTAVVKRFPYRNSASCEIEQLARMQAKGYGYELLPLDRANCLGEHGKHYTAETIFKRWQRCFQKHRMFGRMEWIEPYARRLLDRYVATGETLHLYAFLGAVAGITDSALPSTEMDWRDENAALTRLQHYFPIRPDSAARS